MKSLITEIARKLYSLSHFQVLEVVNFIDFLSLRKSHLTSPNQGDHFL